MTSRWLQTRLLAGSFVAAVAVSACSASNDTASRPVADSPAPISLTTNVDFCRRLQEIPVPTTDTRVVWAQINNAGLRDILAIGWTPGIYNEEADGLQRKRLLLNATLPVAREILTAQPDVDIVAVTITGTNLEASFKTVYSMPADALRTYTDTPQGRNRIQSLIDTDVELLDSFGPLGKQVTDSEGLYYHVYLDR